MKLSEKTLLAYVDNELDAATRHEVEAAIAADPALARRVEQQRTLRKLLGAAYDPVARDSVPGHSQPAPQSVPPGAKVVRLAAARKERERERNREMPSPSPLWGWPTWAGLAVGVALGLLAGRSGLFTLPGEAIAVQDARVVARGSLALALSMQLAGGPPAGAPVKIDTSFMSRGRELCRSFALTGTPTAGLACRRGTDWELRLITQERGAAPASIPPVVQRAVDEQRQGDPLDAAGERAAMGRGWQP
jgi:hypothetical protein